MAPLTESQRHKLLMEQEIARLSGAISRHAAKPTHTTQYHPYRGRGSSTQAFRGRAQHPRGRGGKVFGLDLREQNKRAAQAAPAASSSSGPSKLAEASQTTSREEGEVSPPLQDVEQVNKGSASKDSPAWVASTSRTGNMSLMTVQKSQQLKAKPPPLRMKRSRIPAEISVLTSTGSVTGAGGAPRKVVIDGIIFQFEEGGSKLVRIGEVSSVPVASNGTQSVGTPTRRSIQYEGQKYRRTSKGNLVAASRRAELAKKPCRYYTKTGRCNRALTCPYAHIPGRLAICPRFLRSTCPHTTTSCPLSHEPSAHNTPSCIHFQTSSTCKNGPSCLYPHVRVAEGAPVCEAFSRGGWCDKEAGSCPELHVWECGEWRARGTCSRGAKCGLQHVIRAETGKASMAKAAEVGLPDDEKTRGGKVLPVEGGFEENSEFIGLPSSPGPITSEEEDDEPGSEDGSGEESEEAESEEGSEDDLEPSEHSPSDPPDESMDSDEVDEDVLGVVA